MLAHIGHFNQIHTAAWVPLALYGLQVTREGYYRAGTAAAAVGFALLWLAGHPLSTRLHDVSRRGARYRADIHRSSTERRRRREWVCRWLRWHLASVWPLLP